MDDSRAGRPEQQRQVEYGGGAGQLRTASRAGAGASATPRGLLGNDWELHRHGVALVCRTATGQERVPGNELMELDHFSVTLALWRPEIYRALTDLRRALGNAPRLYGMW